MGINPSVLYQHLLNDLEAAGHGSSIDRDVDHEPNAELFAVNALKKSIFSKFRDDIDPQAEARALREFMHANLACMRWVPKRVSHNTRLSAALGELQAAFNKCFELPDGTIIDFYQACGSMQRPGPGVAVGSDGNDFYTKVADGPMGFETQSCEDMFLETVLCGDLEATTEESRANFHGYQRVGASKLGFAPKKREISRITVSQASGNMLLQLGAGSLLEEILASQFNLSLTSQPSLNAELARRGSLGNGYATVDLKMCSDLQSRMMYYWLFLHKGPFRYLDMIRSKAVLMPSGFCHKLHMFGENGTGFTFPLQTLLFACVIRAVYRVLDIPFKKNSLAMKRKIVGIPFDAIDPCLHERFGTECIETSAPGNWGVFGDDLIVVERAVPLLFEVLGWLGLVVNEDKSYWKGDFRESCGSDYFQGVNVRGVYCKSLRTNARRLTLFNRLSAWSANHGIMLHDTLAYLQKYVHADPVPIWESGDAGIIMPLTLAQPLIFSDRERPKLARTTGNRGFVKTMGKTRFEKYNEQETNYLGSFIYTRFEAKSVKRNPCKDSHGKDADHVNFCGVMQAAVRGYLQGGYLTLRQKGEPRYQKRVSCVAPGWGYTGTSQVDLTPEGARRFESYAAQSLIAVKR